MGVWEALHLHIPEHLSFQSSFKFAPPKPAHHLGKFQRHLLQLQEVLGVLLCSF